MPAETTSPGMSRRADAQQIVGIHHHGVLRDALPYRQVARFLPIGVGQRRFGAGPVGVHDKTCVAVAGEVVGNDFAECFRVEPLVDILDGRVHVLLGGGDAAPGVTGGY